MSLHHLFQSKGVEAHLSLIDKCVQVGIHRLFWYCTKWVVSALVFYHPLCSAQVLGENYDKPVLTVRVIPAQPYVQEQIVQTVTMVSAHPFETLKLELPQVAGARAVTLQKPRTRAYATYGFEGYVYETARALFAETSGELVIPAVSIVGSVLRPDRSIDHFNRSSDATTLNIAPQPQSFGNDDQWLIAKDLSIVQEYAKPLDELRVGDIVERRFTLTARGVTAEHLPLLTLRRTRYLTVLPGAVTRKTRVDAEGVTATLVQSFDLQLDAENLIDFAPVTLAWWDGESDRLQRASVPAARVEPLPKDSAALVAGLMHEAQQRYDRTRSTVVFLLAVVTGIVVLTVLFTGLRRWRDYARDRVLLKAIKSNSDPARACVLLSQWCRERCQSTVGFTSRRSAVTELESLLVHESLESGLRRKIRQLQALAFGSPQAIDQPCQNLSQQVAVELVDHMRSGARAAGNKDRGRRTQLWLNNLLGEKRLLSDPLLQQERKYQKLQQERSDQKNIHKQ